MNYSSLKSDIAAVVRENGNQEITGDNLQGVLTEMIDNSVGTGYLYKGIATPETQGGTPDQNVFYLAGAGTYGNFSSTIPEGSVGVFRYNGAWAVDVFSIGLEKDIASRLIAFSNYNDLNKVICDVYAPTINKSEIAFASASVAVLISTKYYNAFYFKNSANQNIISYERAYDTKQDALDAFNKGVIQTTNAVIYVNYFDDSFSVSTPTGYGLEIFSTLKNERLNKTYRDGNKITIISENYDGLFTQSNNLFDGSYIDGYWAGTFQPVTPYRATTPIQVELGETYKYKAASTFGGNRAKYGMYDANKEFIGIGTGTLDSDGITTITIEDVRCFYVSANIGRTDTETGAFMFCADSYPSNYVPYSKKIKEDYFPNIGNILYGKKISFNGDSICAGADSAGGYGKIIADRNAMTYQNIAVGGATIASDTYSGETPRHWISQTITSMDADADFAIIEGGVNDPANDAIGSMSNGYSATLDTTTFYGAFEYMCKQLITRFAGKKIGYIAVHKMQQKFSSIYTGSDNYYLAAKECCEKWGVPFLDLNVELPAFGFFPQSETALYALRSDYTYNADGWHPNEQGYLKYYCDKIESWLKTL